MSKSKVRISITEGYERPQGRPARILAELALKTPRLSLDLSDKDTVLSALPTILNREIEKAQQMVDNGLILDAEIATKPQ